MPVAERETTQHEDPILFRTEAARGLELGINGVDRGTATIAGAAIMQAGVVKDGRFEVDAKTLKQLVTLGNHGKLGVKVRFGHPSMSDDALGTFLGLGLGQLRIGAWCGGHVRQHRRVGAGEQDRGIVRQHPMAQWFGNHDQ